MKAISATFRNRGTTIEAEPMGLTQAYCDDPARAIQWRAFVRRSRFSEESGELARLVTEIRQLAFDDAFSDSREETIQSSLEAGRPLGVRSCIIRVEPGFINCGGLPSDARG